MLSHGERDVGKMVKTGSMLAAVFAPNLVPGGKRTSIYSIQKLARKHPDWYRADLADLLAMLSDGAIDPQIAATWELHEVPAAAIELAGGSLPGKQVIAVAAHH